MHLYPTKAAEARPTLLSWSGGKDCAVALRALRSDPGFEVVGLLTMVTAGYDRISIHGVRRTLLEAQARSLGLPLYTAELEPASSNEAYEAAFHAGLKAARLSRRFTHIAFGDLHLADVRAYRELLLMNTNYTAVFPLWGQDVRRLSGRIVDGGFVARLVCVDTTQLDASFAGRLYDRVLLGQLPSSVDPCGENGEFHTFVSAGPGFKSPIPYEVGEKVLRDGRFMYCDLVPSDRQPAVSGA
jgi:uncharacterized protein (TIGR00290 family)